MDLAVFAVEYASKLGAEYAEARLQSDMGNVYLVKNGNPEVAGFVRERGLGIRVLVKGGLGFASVNLLNKRLVEKRVREAVGMARASVRVMKKPIKLSDEKTFEDKWEIKPKVPFDDVSVEEKMGLFSDLDKTVSSPEEVGISIPYRVFQLIETTTEKNFVNSEGAILSSKIPRVLFFGLLTGHEANRGTEQDSIEKGESRGWEAMREWNLMDHVRERAKILGKILKTAEEAPRERVDLVLGNQVVGLMVHESTGHPYEADRILGREAAQAGESFLTRDMLGKRIGTEVVSVVDDPTLKNSYGYYLYDDEGVPARRRFLMKNGIINEFLHNRETAAEIGVSSNASARASGFDREPLVRMGNTFMLPGDYTFKELLEDIQLGIYIKTFGEWNIDDRRYNMRFVGRECYLIEKGEVRGMIRRPILELTTPGFYSSIDALDSSLTFEGATCGKGDPGQGMPVWHGGPNARLRSIRLGGI